MAIHSEPGIFSHTNIDPTDDLSFWTTAGFSNSFIGTVTVFFQTMNVYSWQSAWATLTPPQVIFEGSENIPEVENLPSCNNYPTAMQLQVTSLPNSQPGDVLIAVVAGGGGTSASATGWTQLGSPLVSNGSCGQSSTSWVFAHQYPATDPLPYVFNVGVSAPTDTCNTNFCWAGEAAGYLVDYRGASSNFSNYTEYGYPNNSDVNPATSSSTQAISVPASNELLNIFSHKAATRMKPEPAIQISNFPREALSLMSKPARVLTTATTPAFSRPTCGLEARAGRLDHILKHRPRRMEVLYRMAGGDTAGAIDAP